jgi:hypothetical protein
MRPQHRYQWPLSSSAELSEPSTNASSARRDSRIANTAVLREYVLAAHRPHTDTLCIAFKQQVVPRTHAQDAPHLTGNSDLPLACDLCLFLRGDLPFPNLNTLSLLWQVERHNHRFFLSREPSRVYLGARSIESGSKRCPVSSKAVDSVCTAVHPGAQIGLCNRVAQTGASVRRSANEPVSITGVRAGCRQRSIWAEDPKIMGTIAA